LKYVFIVFLIELQYRTLCMRTGGIWIHTSYQSVTIWGIQWIPINWTALCCKERGSWHS